MQSNGARAGLALLLVAIAVALFVVLQDDGSSSGEPRAATPGQTATTDGDPGSTPQKPQKPPAIPEIAVKGGAPVGGVAELEFTSGDRVRFRVRSDEPGEVHVHGYEITEPVEPGAPVTLSFRADIQGAYEVELHGHSSGEFQIGELAVSPG